MYFFGTKNDKNVLFFAVNSLYGALFYRLSGRLTLSSKSTESRNHSLLARSLGLSSVF